MSKLERRVVTAAEQALTRQRHVSPLDVLTGLGWVRPGLRSGRRRSADTREPAARAGWDAAPPVGHSTRTP